MGLQNKSNNLYESGVSAFLNREYDQSIDNFTRAMEAGDKSYALWVSRGAAYLQSNRIELALGDFSRAITTRPKHPRGYHMRALAHDKQGDAASALTDLDHAIALDPEYGSAFKSRAMVLDKLGRGDEAAADMRMATHLTELRLAEFNNENNVWHSNHMKLEAEGFASEFDR